MLGLDPCDVVFISLIVTVSYESTQNNGKMVSINFNFDSYYCNCNVRCKMKKRELHPTKWQRKLYIYIYIYSGLPHTCKYMRSCNTFWYIMIRKVLLFNVSKCISITVTFDWKKKKKVKNKCIINVTLINYYPDKGAVRCSLACYSFWHVYSISSSSFLCYITKISEMDTIIRMYT